MVQLRKGQVRQEAAKAMIAAGADGGLRLKLEKATAAAEAATAAVAAAEAALAAEGAPKAIAVPAASEPTDAGPSAVADEEGAAAATLAMRDAAAAALKRELAAGRSKEGKAGHCLDRHVSRAACRSGHDARTATRLEDTTGRGRPPGGARGARRSASSIGRCSDERLGRTGWSILQPAESQRGRGAAASA
jgi:hypothetical protein